MEHYDYDGSGLEILEGDDNLDNREGSGLKMENLENISGNKDMSMFLFNILYVSFSFIRI